MKIIKTRNDMVKFRQSLKGTVGFVPTMGALHQGHISLIKKAKECDHVLVSIFVNPIQFSENEDFEKYPKDFEKDKELCENEKVDAIFYPSVQEIYTEELERKEEITPLTSKLCGKTRPTHFYGVKTVVRTFFDIIKPDKAYFGLKDYQQYLVIKEMVKDENIDTEIVPCKTIREPDGLAMSSRNKYLTKEERQQAAIIYRSLTEAKESIESEEKDINTIKEHIKTSIQSQPSAKIDYIEILDAETLEYIKTIDKKVVIAVAVYFNKTRLIDNILVEQ